MSEALETIEYKSHTIEIMPDYSSENPIKCSDVLGEYVCWHRRYELGNSTRFKNPEELVSYAKRTNSLLYPLYIYDHSGISLSLTNTQYPFSDRWDSGQLGYVLIDRSKALRQFGKKKLTTQLKKRIEQVIAEEIETYNQFLSGDVFGYVITQNGEEISSCWGFYGLEFCLSEAKACVEYEIQQNLLMHTHIVKQWIKNRVPHIHRHQFRWC
jgi:hypothetical protein